MPELPLSNSVLQHMVFVAERQRPAIGRRLVHAAGFAMRAALHSDVRGLACRVLGAMQARALSDTREINRTALGNLLQPNSDCGAGEALKEFAWLCRDGEPLGFSLFHERAIVGHDAGFGHRSAAAAALPR